MRYHDTITDIPGIRVGHQQDNDALTGCTVILCESGAVAGIDQRGGAPGTRETDLLRPIHLVQEVQAVLLTGGSVFGLSAADGVVRYLEENGVGFDTGIARIPIVPAMVLLDLNLGDNRVRPDAEMGYQACLLASIDEVTMGNVGAGSGASVGKVSGVEHAVKTGLGSACVEISDGIKVGAIVATNALGDILDPINGEIIAGTLYADWKLNKDKKFPIFADSLKVMSDRYGKNPVTQHGNTVIGVVATNARLTKEQVNKVAQMAHDGLARVVRPAHTMFDGDTIIALSIPLGTGNPSHRMDTGSSRFETNEVSVLGADEVSVLGADEVSVLGAIAADTISLAILRSVQLAAPAGGLPSYQSFHSSLGE